MIQNGVQEAEAILVGQIQNGVDHREVHSALERAVIGDLLLKDAQNGHHQRDGIEEGEPGGGQAHDGIQTEAGNDGGDDRDDHDQNLIGELAVGGGLIEVRNGAELKRGSAVAGVEDLGDHYVVHTASGNYESRYLVNCAGVHGHEISAMVGESEWMPKHSRGEYYLLDKSSGDLVNHVIFQCPSVLGKGVLVAPTVHGNLIVGPNAEPVEDGDDRATTQSGLDQVAAFGRKSVPSIDLRQSIRNFSGVRAVTSEEDFIIRPAKNSPRMLYVCGIKSPGLSAAPAIADYALEKLKEMGLAAEKKTMWSGKRTQIRFRKLSDSEKAELVRKDPRYGRIICRCETITEGEIIAAIHSPIPPCSIDGVKRRTGAGMGRCQGGFCGPRVLKILADELGKDPMEIVQDGSATWLLMEETKGGSGK